jgi:hypothetical protein
MAQGHASDEERDSQETYARDDAQQSQHAVWSETVDKQHETSTQDTHRHNGPSDAPKLAELWRVPHVNPLGREQLFG